MSREVRYDRTDQAPAQADSSAQREAPADASAQETFIYLDLSEVDVNLTPGTKLQIEVRRALLVSSSQSLLSLR